MRKYFESVSRLLSTKRASLFILFFCFAAKSLLISFYSYTGRDKIYHLSASYNLLHGKGWTNSFYYLGNPGREVIEPYCHWPPGYGLLLTPFQVIFGYNIFLATTVLEIICFIIFILLCRGILRTQKVSLAWVNLSTVLLTFFSHDFIEASLGTDLLALDCMLGFFYCILRGWEPIDRRAAAALGIAGGLCLFFAGFTRYMYVPVCLLAALLLVGLAYWKRNHAALRAYLAALVVGAVGLGAAMLYQDAACGSPFFVNVEEKGFFPQNLDYWHPTTIAATLNLNMVPIQLEKLGIGSFESWLKWFSMINWVLYLLIIIVVIGYFTRNWKNDASRFPLFELAGSVISAAIIGELVGLSLTNAAKPTVHGTGWTFIEEGRYHAFPLVFMQLFLLKQVALPRAAFKAGRFFRRLLIAGFFLMVLTSLHQFYYTAKVALDYKVMKRNSAREKDYVFFMDLLEKTIREEPGKDILVAATDMYYPLLASMKNSKGLADGFRQNESLPRVEKPAILLTVVSGTPGISYSPYLEKHRPALIGEVAGTRFYRQELNPADQP